MGVIATENQAASIGGGSPYTNNLCATKTRAQALGCTVSGSYSDNQLVELSSLEAASKHTQIQYLQSTRGQYIDTLIPSGNDCILTIDGLYDHETGDSQHGTMISASDGRYHMGVHGGMFSGGLHNLDTHLEPYDNDRHTFEINGFEGYISIDGFREFVVPYRGSKSLNIYIFARNTNGTADCWTYFKLYECWIKKINNTNGSWISVRHFIPVIHTSQGPCLYDTVSDTYFVNKGSGSFTAGPNI